MWVKGHNDMPWNEMADSVANLAREAPTAFPDHVKHIQHLEDDDYISRRFILERGRMGDAQYPEMGIMPKKINGPCERLDSDELARPYMRAVQEPRHEDRKEGHNDITVMTLNALTLLRKGRTHIIKTQMKKAKVQIAGLQETRIRKASRGECDDFRYVNGARSEGSANHGCSIWISKKIGKTNVERHHIKAVVQKPRYVIAAVRCSAIHAMVVSAHAPHAVHTMPEIESFWEELKSAIMKTNTAGLPIIVMADMNCQPCPLEGRVGKLTDDARKVEMDHPAMRFLQDMDLCIPHTYEEVNCRGQLEPTCYSGGETKIDYVMIPAQWRSSAKSSAVVKEVDPSLGRLDHCPVATTFARPTTKAKIIRSRHQLPFDIAKVKDKKNADKVKAIMDDAPKPDWQVDQDTHLHMINQHMVARLTEEFPRSKKKQRPEWMAVETIRLIEEKHDCYKELKEVRTAGEAHDDGGRRRDLLEKKLKALCKQVAKAVGRDRERQIDELAQACDVQFSMNDTHKAYKSLKRLRPFAARPMNIQTTEEGLPVLDQQQAEHEWGARWKKLLDGEDTSFQDLFSAKKTEEQTEKLKEHNVSLYLPTLGETARHIITAKPGKMHGNDLLPIGVWKVDPNRSAKMMAPIYMKTLVTMQWPVAWKGDTHQAIPKAAGKYRGICLADCSGKLLNRSMRAHVIAEVEDKAPDLTCGGVPQKGADFAAHALEQACSYLKAKNRSHAFLFVDVVSAFDNVSRSLLKEAGEGTLVGKIMGAIHEETWTTTQFTDQAYITRRGVKQGDPISDATFLYLFVDAINLMRQRISDEGLASIITTRTHRRKPAPQREQLGKPGDGGHAMGEVVVLETRSDERSRAKHGRMERPRGEAPHAMEEHPQAHRQGGPRREGAGQ
eukprot:TRINITY_DN26020_c0_g1_i1.p1 TRINITY_DN26020_c0_g1~~TRINITY_DN26020_c0_g1_i1.p1  ORF type:complete len:894 (+),score=170.76 TRINITY_DN26020_c0_g1_i1:3-2684(+)